MSSERRGPRWIVQTDLGSTRDPERLTEACRSLGLPVVHATFVPFSDELPDISESGPTLVYGSDRFVSLARASGRWRPCAFHDEEGFRASSVVARWGRDTLNSDGRLTTLRALASESDSEAEQLFLRPDADHKNFAGALYTRAEITRWVTRLEAAGELVTQSADTEVFAAPPKPIADEWRLFLVEGRVIAGSRYRSHGRLDVHPGVPDAVTRFAEGLAATWQPAPAFVLDVARTGEGLRAIEVNGLHSSGFYAADVKAIVAAVSELAVR